MIKQAPKNSNRQNLNEREFQFPTWPQIISEFLNDGLQPDSPNYIPFSEIEVRLKKLDQVKNSISEFHPAQIIQMLSNPSNHVIPENELSELIDRFSNICIADNQFYTLYNINVGWHTRIDPNIERALGLKPEDFSLKAMAGLDPYNPLYHPDDVYHMMRHAGIGYLILQFPGFEWKTMRDYYVVRHRVGTERSSSELLKSKKYVTLEKRCYPVFAKDESGLLKPIYHFDQWSVLDATDFDFVRPMWVTSTEQSNKLNGLLYLFNAYLLDFTPKQLAFLNERVYFDRNKSIANSINDKIELHTSIRGNFDEIQIGNSFSKTIRPKTAQVMNIWNFRKSHNLYRVESDQAAVHHCRSLGVLPIPSYVSSILYRLVKH